MNFRLHIIKSLLALVILMFALVSASFAQTLQTNSNFQIIHSDASGIRMIINSDVSDVEELDINGRKYIKPIINGIEIWNTPENQGSPASLGISNNLLIPSPRGFRLQSFKVLATKHIKGDLYPNPDYDFQQVKYNPIAEKYTNHTKSNPINVYYKGIAGDRYVAGIEFRPVQYSPNTHDIEVITKSEVYITFDARDAYVSSRKPGRIISLLNEKTAPNWTVHPASDEDKYQDKLQGNIPLSWGKVKIEKEGVYYLSADDLKRAGLEVTKDNINTLRIYGLGGVPMSFRTSLSYAQDLPEQEFYVEKTADGNLDKIVFYAAAPKGVTWVKNTRGYSFVKYINPYSKDNYYTISLGGEVNAKINSIPPADDTKEYNNLLTYRHYIYEEEDLINPVNDGSGTIWYGKSFFPMTISNKLYNLDRNGVIDYTFRMGLQSSRGGRFTFTENGTALKDVNISDNQHIIGSTTRFSAMANTISKDDRSVMKIEYSDHGNDPASAPYIDYMLMSYPRSFNAIDNQMKITLDSIYKGDNLITAVQFSADKIYSWDISNMAYPKLVRNYSTTPSICIMKVNTDDYAGNHFFLCSKPMQASIEKVELANLRNTKDEVDMLIITHPDLEASAKEYAEYRTSRGVKSKVYLTTDIYNEFGAGMPGPYTIRNFISYMYNNSAYKPQFVYIWGGTHYDYRNIVEQKTLHVPIFEGDNVDFTSYSSTDEYFVYVSGDDYLMDLAVGRATINNNEEGRLILEKMKHYESSSSNDDWRNTITLLGDDSFKENGSRDTREHIYQCESVANLESLRDFTFNKIYMSLYPIDQNSAKRKKSAVTKDIINTSNKGGALIFAFVGHGNPRVWAHEEVLTREETIPLFKNYDKMFFCYTATCDFARYDLAGGVKSGGEEMFKHKHGGAIALYSTLRSVDIMNNGILFHLFFKNLLTRDENNEIMPIGNIVNITRNSRNTNYIHTNDFLYCLVGDPSLRLLLPSYEVSINEIQGVKISDSLETAIELKGLDKVNVKGEIRNNKNEIASDFNGFALVNLYDAMEKLAFSEANGYDFEINKLGNALGKNSVKVKNGLFEIEFYIPKDISFSEGNAKLSIYAISHDSTKTANGSTDKIKISSINEDAVIETDGPEINLYLDSRRFVSGQEVSDNPLLIVDLKDESGINTAGAGIGHRIEAWIDDNPEGIDLTSLYKSSFDVPNTGTIERILEDLKPGMHTLKVRAWDVFNNYTVSFTDFKIGDKQSGAIILNTYMYPNPIIESGNISITHSIAAAYDIHIKMYNSMGVLVNEISKAGTNLNAVITEWDGHDKWGVPLSAGSYFYSVELKTKTETAIGHGKFTVVK